MSAGRPSGWFGSTNNSSATAESYSMSTDVTVDYNHLNGLLWRYRPYLDRIEFLLEIQLMVGASGRIDWQRHLADLLDQQARAVATLDLEREALLGPGRTIADVATTAPEPWSEILEEQQREMEALTVRVGRLRQRNLQALEQGLAGLTKLIDEVVGGGSTPLGGYDQAGRLTAATGATADAAVLFDGRV